MTAFVRALLTAAGFALATAPVALADESAGPAPDDRLRRLEEALERQTRETERLRRDFDRYRSENPAGTDPLRGVATDPAVALDAYLARAQPVVPIATSGGARGLRWGGYLTLEYLDPSNAVSRFDLHRLVLAADGPITDLVDFAMELEIEHGGISDEIEGEVVLERAEVRFHVSDCVVPKLGWLLIPFGRYNLNHDDPLNDFTIRPFTARYLVPTGFGQPGIGVEGSRPLGRGHVFSYDVALTNGFRDAFTDDEGTREARHARDENDGKQVWARAAVLWDTACALDVLETGLSGTYGVYDDRNRNAISGYGLDFLLRKGPFEAKGEFLAYDYERNSSDPPGAIEGQKGLWLEAAWHFFPDFFCGACGPFVTDTSLFTLAVRYEWMDLDDHVRGASFRDDLESVAVGLNYRITERSVFRIDHTWLFPARESDETQWAASFSTSL